MSPRSSDGEWTSSRALSSAPLLHPVPEAPTDQRDLIQTEADPKLQREAETAGEPTAREAVVMPPH